MAEGVFGLCVGVVNLVAEDNKGDVGEGIPVQEEIEFVLGLRESLGVDGVDQEDDTVDFGEVISPDTAG